MGRVGERDRKKKKPQGRKVWETLVYTTISTTHTHTHTNPTKKLSDFIYQIILLIHLFIRINPEEFLLSPQWPMSSKPAVNSFWKSQNWRWDHHVDPVASTHPSCPMSRKVNHFFDSSRLIGMPIPLRDFRKSFSRKLFRRISSSSSRPPAIRSNMARVDTSTSDICNWVKRNKRENL